MDRPAPQPWQTVVDVAAIQGSQRRDLQKSRDEIQNGDDAGQQQPKEAAEHGLLPDVLWLSERWRHGGCEYWNA
jgi:hypothetical protein